jgi:hypothetical protein
MAKLSSGLHFGLAAALFGAVITPAAAATIYGSISENQQPARTRPMELRCPGQNPVPGKTDERGSYRFTVPVYGSCVVRVGNAEAPVILSVNPMQYNFDLRQANGRAVLVQR